MYKATSYKFLELFGKTKKNTIYQLSQFDFNNMQ